MQKVSRRKFINNSLIASGSLMIPGFVKGIDRCLVKNNNSDKKLVVIHLFGGNDGLNTIVPYRNDIYYKLRPKLNIPPKNVLPIDDNAGFNKLLEPLQQLLDKNELCIINGVGYPDPIYSHFKSSQVWHTAFRDKFSFTGWLGRYIDTFPKENQLPHQVVLLDELHNIAVKGHSCSGITFSQTTFHDQIFSNNFSKQLIKNAALNAEKNSNDFLYLSAREAYSSFEYLEAHYKNKPSIVDYPNHYFSGKLKSIASFMRGGASTRVYYVTLSGFDTHSDQKNLHSRLLNVFGNSLLSFVKELKQDALFKDTCIMVFSEFGRRPEENGSSGTDHGSANNLFIIGDNLKKYGMYNPLPDLENMEHGNLKYSIDFRSIYATLLKKWLRADDELILKNKFQLLDFI